jgi:aldehyde dehydrogenase (NAD+)
MAELACEGRAGFEVFSHRRSVLAKPTRLDPKLACPPYTRLKERLIRRFL